MVDSRVSTDTLDITDREQLENRLRELLQRFAEVGRQGEELLDALVELHERDRHRIVRDIHDDPLQLMTTVARRLGLLRQRAPAGLHEELMGLERLAKRAVVRLRRVMLDPAPLGLDHLRLLPALRATLHEMDRQAGIGYVLQNRLSAEPPPEARIVLLRIAEEALANVRAHARAQRVEVWLEEWRGGVRLRVRDDGKGFDAAEAAESRGHFGLRVMRERAELAGGWLTVDATPGAGTRIECWVPIRPRGV